MRRALAACRRMPPAVKASVSRTPCVIIMKHYVSLCRIHGRPPARGFPPWFSRALSETPFPRSPRLWAARQKVTAYETTIRGATPRLKSSPRLLGSATQGKRCPASVGFLPPLCGRSAFLCFGCSVGVVGAVRCVGSVLLGKGVCTTVVATLHTFNYGEFCFCQGLRKCICTLDKNPVLGAMSHKWDSKILWLHRFLIH